MEAEARERHVLRLRNRVQAIKNAFYPISLLRIDSAVIALSKEAIQSLMAKTANHG